MYHDLNGEKTGISVISCNCTGGCVMKEYNMRFMSPTINLAIGAADFLKFCQNLRYYTSLAPSLALEPIQSTQTYPLIMLGDILIHAIHYDSFDNFCEAWNRRVSRINFDKLFYIFSDRDGFTVELLPEIDKLETPKVMFAKEKYDDYDWICVVPGFEKEKEVGILTDYMQGITWKRRYSVYDFAKTFRELMRS